MRSGRRRKQAAEPTAAEQNWLLMQVFRDHERTTEAVEIPQRLPGELAFATIIRVKGDHRTGPVPVEIEHTFHFRYDEPLPVYEGSEVNSTTRSFDSAEERDMYVSNHFELAAHRV